MKSYSQMINIFTKKFANVFCKDNGDINWDKLVRFNKVGGMSGLDNFVGNKIGHAVIFPLYSIQSE